MKKKCIFSSLIILYLFSWPTYCTSFEEISIFKIILQLMFYLGVFIAVIILSIYGTRLVAKNYKKVTSSRHIELLDILNIPGGSKIAIVKINENIYILSITNNSTTVIDKFYKEEFNVIDESFDNYLGKYFDKWNIGSKSKKLLNKLYLKKDKEDINDEKKD